jgi:predicted anti-sigma-YlaC factor YlaD
MELVNTTDNAFGPETCAAVDIAAYLDGELSFEDERELEDHFSICSNCSEELNHQKQFLCCLDASLKNEHDLELPPDFARSVVANAEANVTGLRRPSEVYNSLFVCAALALFILFAAGAGANEILGRAYDVIDRVTIVGGFFTHLVYDIFLGIAIVVRSFAAQFRVDIIMAVLLSIFLAAPTVFLSRKVLRVGRA